ncbi:ATP-binding protein [Thiospirochaeta perfilievii]|uniref:ATP-binding protein n=1 Tax=Thiospirochaeta perfilievii TaxID=252967 RepID=A0A5C1QGT5_9SPIO|nr:ATP-binding protein [Thiospirochaeta perfilievii]QEN05442.1 ATP-binding protein [Thiospirochaeta perfilievii]
MIKRSRYTDKLVQYKDNDFVKVVTGVRRSGKSSLLVLFKEYLIAQGVEESHIIEINYEKYLNDDLKDEKSIHNYIKVKVKDSSRIYLLIDEVQEISNWAKVINSLRVSFNADIYVTGSNSRMFSGEHLTYLSGRYIEIKVLPLSFKEFLEFRSYSEENAQKHFNEYLLVGSFPAVSLANGQELVEAILSGLFDSIFTRDIILRGKIRDEGAFYKVAKFVFENIGNNTSANAIKNTMISQGHKITSDTVDNYLQLMCDAHMLYQCERYDIRGKERLKTNGKYYVVDTGLRNRLIGYRSGNLGHVIENIVYLQLLRLGYEVTVGKNTSSEVDFIAVKGDKRLYFQVSLTCLEEKTYAREMNALLKINDQYPKYLITMDSIDLSKDGIIHINLYDFLLENINFEVK